MESATDSDLANVLLHNHEIQTMINQIKANASQQIGIDGPTATNLQIVAAIGSIAGKEIFGTPFVTHILYALDPPEGSNFQLTENPGSPYFSSLSLPLIGGINAYQISYETGSVWSADQLIDPATFLDFGPGVDGIAINGLNGLGEIVPIDDVFLPTVTSASDGIFEGAMTWTPVPEPSSVLIFLSSLALIIFVKKRYSVPERS